MFLFVEVECIRSCMVASWVGCAAAISAVVLPTAAGLASSARRDAPVTQAAVRCSEGACRRCWRRGNLRGGRNEDSVADEVFAAKPRWEDGRWASAVSPVSARAPSGEAVLGWRTTEGLPHFPDGEREGGPKTIKTFALVTFGLLGCGAYTLSRLNDADSSLGWALKGFAYVNSVLALGGVVGNRADLLGVPIFALLSMPSLLAAAVSPSALTYALARLAHLDAQRGPACYFPGGFGTVQTVALGVGLMTVHSTLVHLWTRSDMVADRTWAQLGLVHYRCSPRPPTLTLLIAPLMLIGTSLNIGLHLYKTRRGAGVLAGAIAMLSGVLGPEASCVWSSHVGQLLLAFAVFLRLRPHGTRFHAAGGMNSSAGADAPRGARGGWTEASTCVMALKAATEAAFGARERRQLARALGVQMAPPDLTEENAQRVPVPAGVWFQLGLTRRGAEWAQQAGEIVLLALSAAVPQLAAAIPRYLLGKLTREELDAKDAQQDSARTDVRIAANTLLVSPRIHQMSGSASMGHWRYDAAPAPAHSMSPVGDISHAPSARGMLDAGFGSALAHAPLLPFAASLANPNLPHRDAAGRAGDGEASPGRAPLSIAELTTASRTVPRSWDGSHSMSPAGQITLPTSATAPIPHRAVKSVGQDRRGVAAGAISSPGSSAVPLQKSRRRKGARPPS